MKSIIVYASKYGSTKRYAEELSRRIGVRLIGHKDIKSKEYKESDTIIYMGRLYGGKVDGIEKMFHKANKNARLIIVAVGISRVEGQHSLEAVKRGLKSYLVGGREKLTDVFYLRGAVDYSTMKGMDKFIMSLVNKMLSKSEDEDARTIRDTYGKTVDFVDLSALEPIVETYNNLNK